MKGMNDGNKWMFVLLAVSKTNLEDVFCYTKDVFCCHLLSDFVYLLSFDFLVFALTCSSSFGTITLYLKSFKVMYFTSYLPFVV